MATTVQRPVRRNADERPNMESPLEAALWPERMGQSISGARRPSSPPLFSASRSSSPDQRTVAACSESTPALLDELIELAVGRAEVDVALPLVRRVIPAPQRGRGYVYSSRP